MKPLRLCHLLLLPALWAPQFAQATDSTFVRRFDQYELEKKDVATAYLATTILPGAGAFYAREDLQGVGFLAWSAAMVIWAGNTDQRAGPIVGVVVGKVLEYAMDSWNVDRYNERLRRSLDLAYNGNTLSLKFTLTF